MTHPPLRHRVLGIDPGSRNTGYGVIDTDGQRSTCVARGCVRVGQHAWPERLGLIFDQVAALVAEHRPHEMAVEQLIFARDATAALKIGQARGAVLCAGLKGGVGSCTNTAPSRSSSPWSAPATRRRARFNTWCGYSCH